MDRFNSFVDKLGTIAGAQPVVPTMILFALLLFAFIVLMRAQSRDDFDLADMLKDEAGKVSNTRMFSFICLAVTSWIVAYLTISDKITSEYFWYYLVVWSGTAVALKLVDKWNGTLPFSKGDMQQAMQSGAQAAAMGAAAASPNSSPVIVQMPPPPPAPVPPPAPEPPPAPMPGDTTNTTTDTGQRP